MVVARVSAVQVELAGGLATYVKELIERIRMGTMEVKEKAASTLACLADQEPEATKAMGNNSAIPPLVALVLVGSPLAQEHSAACLALIARSNSAYQQAIIDNGAILPLATLLRSGGGGAQEQAAAAFASLSDNAEAQKTMLKMGCVPILVELLRRGSSAAQINACQALAKVAELNLEGQTQVYQTGAVKYLLLLLGTGKAQEYAARTLARMAHRNGIIQADVCRNGGIARLLALLSERNVEAQIQAAAALSELAQGPSGIGHRKTQDAISKAGGIGPLLAMVECNPVVIRAIAESVKCLAEVARRNRANQDTIAAMGGIKPLVELIQSGGHNESVQANAALAITEICRRNADNQTTVADIGGISQLVVLLRNSGKPKVDAEVAGAMWTLSVDHPTNKVSIASAGAIQTLVQLLGSNNERAQVHSANALASLALDNADNQAQMSPLLVGLLGNPDEGTQKRAAKSLWRIVKENPENQAHIAKAGGAEKLVDLLQRGSAGAKNYALWSLSLSIDKDNREIVSEKGGVPWLVKMLNSDNLTVTKQAAAALASLARNNDRKEMEKDRDPAQEIAKSGGIAPLISLLDRTESEGTREHAAAALSELAQIERNQTSIDRAGGIGPLVALLLFDGAFTSKKHAASALARMSEGNRDEKSLNYMIKKHEKEQEKAQETNQKPKKPLFMKAEQIAKEGAITPLVNLLNGMRGVEAQEAAALALWSLAGDSNNRLIITDAGGIGPLVFLLGCTNPKAREHAEKALVRLSIEVKNRELIIKQLVSMLNDSGTAAQEQAAAALANLASDSEDNRASIVDAGGIQPLLRLLLSDSDRAKENAAKAITQLCATRDNQDAIAAADGVKLLVGVLQSSSSNNKDASAITLCSLVAGAIWQLCRDNATNKVLCAQPDEATNLRDGAIGPLVQMLTSPTPEMQSNAAGALSVLSQDNYDNQGAIARTGAIAPLCALVRDAEQTATKEQCASALWSLSTDHAGNKATIAKLGGVEPLVGLLVSGASDKSQEYAAGALASLASKHADNRASIAKRLIGLLQMQTKQLERSAEGQAAAQTKQFAIEKAVRVLGAVSSLSDDHSANQLAIAKVPQGVQTVISWLTPSTPSDDAQREAAHAVLALSANNATTQALIYKSAGIPPLISIVEKSSVEAQEYAARALWHLGSTPETQTAIAEANGIPPLVGMLSAEGQKAAEVAAITIVRLAENNLEVSDSIAACNGIVPLVKLLKDGSPAAQQQSAAALSELALVTLNRNKIAAARGIEPLITLLTDTTVGTPETAARALAHLARDNSRRMDEGQGDNLDDDDEDSGEESNPVENADGIVDTKDEGEEVKEKEGDEDPLETAVDLDKAPESPTAASPESKRAKRTSLSSKPSEKEGDPEKQSTSPSVSPQRSRRISSGAPGSPDTARNRRSSDSMDATARGDSGGQQLTPSKGDQNDIRREARAQAMTRRSSSADANSSLEQGAGERRPSNRLSAIELQYDGSSRRQEIKDCGGIKKLIAMLEDRKSGTTPGLWTTVQQKVVAEGQLSSPYVGIKLGVQEQAAQALCDLAYKDSDMQNEIIRDGGVAPLLNLVHGGTSLAQEHAARALWHLCESTDNHKHIVDAGSIPDLVNLARNGSPAAQEVAAAGLAELAKGGIVDRREREARAVRRAQIRHIKNRQGSPSSPLAVLTQSAPPPGRRPRSTSMIMPPASTLIEPSEEDETPQSNSFTKGAKRRSSNASVLVGDGGSSADQKGAASEGEEEERPPPQALARRPNVLASADTLSAVDKMNPQENDSKLYDDEDDPSKDRLIMITEEGGIVPLVNLLTSGGMTAKEHAAEALWHLALDSSNQLAIAKANGVTPLVALLDDGSEDAVLNGARALSRLAQISADNQAQIAKRLVSLLTSPNTGAQERSAKALEELAKEQPTSPVVIVNAGAILPLVNLIAGGSLPAKIKSAAALSALAHNNANNQLAIAMGLVSLLGTGDLEAQEHVTSLLLELSADPDNRKAIAEAGAIERLSAALKSQSTIVQENAASVLTFLTRDGASNVTACAQAGSIRPLVALLSATSDKAQEQAALVLADMTKGTDRESAENQATVAREGGIVPLVGLLTTAGAAGKAAAAGALWSLARGLPQTQAAVAGAGAVEPLVKLLSSRDSSQQLKASGAISGIAANNLANQNAVTAAGGIPALVKLLDKQHNREVQAHAADALAELCNTDNKTCNTDNQTAVAQAGAIQHLIALLNLDNAYQKMIIQAMEMAAGALWRLSDRHFDNQTAVAQASGIEPLVSLLGKGSDKAQVQAAGALAALALENRDNELTVSESMMHLLDISIVQGAASGTSEKAARGVSRLADAHESLQDSLARARGIEKLVEMIDAGDDEISSGTGSTSTKGTQRRSHRKSYESDPPSGGEEADEQDIKGTWRSPAAQKEVAAALWSMSLHNHKNQQAIAEVEGIPRLISLLDGDALVHRNAAGALWSLADDITNAQRIAMHGGIKRIVDLIHKNGGRAQDTAAGALHSLAALEQNRIAIQEAGGIEPLVAIFDGGSEAAVEQAKGALMALVNNNVRNQGDVAEGLVGMLREGSKGAQSHVTSLLNILTQDPEMRGPIAKAGGVVELVRQLKQGSDSTQSQAAKALSQIALKSAMDRVQVTQQLVSLLGSESEEVRQRAGVALRDMADKGGDESQKMVAMAGGVAPLVALLRDGLSDGRVEAQEYALWSLSLATDQNSRSTIAHEGCVKLLVRSLLTGELSKKAEEDASSVLAGLAKEPENRDDITHRSHDGIPPLVRLVSGNSSTGAKKNAATALARLAIGSEKTQLAMAKAGAITPLVQWLTNESLGQEMTELAARALSDMASDNPVTADEIVDKGAVVPLVKMLEAGRGKYEQTSASGCLATLTKSNFMKEAFDRAQDVSPDSPKRTKKAPAQPSNDEELATADNEDEETPTVPVRQLTAQIVAEAGGIPLLVELLKNNERKGAHKNASRAIWQLAHTPENQIAIAEAGGIMPLVQLLSNDYFSNDYSATQRHAAAAMESLAKDCPENQLALARAKAIVPLVNLLGVDSMETQAHAVGALLYLSSHVECRNAVVRKLVNILDTRNANAQLRAAGALAVLSSRNVTYRNAITEAGAIAPLVRQLGDGLRVENNTPQERAAWVLADLARAAETKVEIVECGGVDPLVRMLGSASNKAQTAAAITLSHLACNGENQIAIVHAQGISQLVAVLAGDNAQAKVHATAALCQLSNNVENKTEIVQAGGIKLLIQVMTDDSHTLQSAAMILSELAKGQLPQKQAIVQAGGVGAIVLALKSGTADAQKYAASALWGLALYADFRKPIVDAGAVPNLVGLLRTSGEAQGYATAALCLLAEVGEGKKAIFINLGVEPLLEIAKETERAWLRGQAVELLALLNIKDPLAKEGFNPGSPPLSPRTPRAGSMSARGPSQGASGEDANAQSGRRRSIDAAIIEDEEKPLDPVESLVKVVTTKVMEVIPGSKPLQLRRGFDLATEKAGELPAKRAIHILQDRMTDDGKTRFQISPEGSVTPMGWITGKQADNKTLLREAGRPVMQVIAAKALTAREDFDLASPKVKDLAAGAFVHVVEAKQTPDGAYRIGFAMEGKDAIKGWVTAIGKDGQLNLNVGVAEPRRSAQLESNNGSNNFNAPLSPERDREKAPEEEAKETPEPDKRRRSFDEHAASHDEPWGDDDEAFPVASNAAEASRSPSVPAVVPPAPYVADAPLATSRKKQTGAAEDSPLGTGRRKSVVTLDSAAESPLGTGRRTSLTPGTTPRASGTTPRPSTSRSSFEQVPPSVPQSSSRGKASTEILVASSKLKMRSGCDTNSSEAGSLPAGTRVHVVETAELPDGTKRARVVREGDTAALGWVSCFAKNGDENLVKPSSMDTASASPRGNVPKAQALPASAFAPSAVPKIATAEAPLLPPTSVASGALTGRSMAKATAAADVAKAALNPAAVAAAEAAAREAVAAQAAAARSEMISTPPAAAPAAVASAIAARVGRPSSSAFHSLSPSGPPAAASRSSPNTPRTPGRAAPSTPGRAAPSTPGRAAPSTPGRAPATPGRSGRSPFAAAPR